MQVPASGFSAVSPGRGRMIVQRQGRRGAFNFRGHEGREKLAGNSPDNTVEDRDFILEIPHLRNAVFGKGTLVFGTN